jgi:hypothetical protein
MPQALAKRDLFVFMCYRQTSHGAFAPPIIEQCESLFWMALSDESQEATFTIFFHGTGEHQFAIRLDGTAHPSQKYEERAIVFFFLNERNSHRKAL